jgi:hypothetical protein
MKVCSIFSQVLKLFSRGGFEKAVKQHKAEVSNEFASAVCASPFPRSHGNRISAEWSRDH